MVSEHEVPDGHLASGTDGRGGYFFLGPGLHRITDPFISIGVTHALNNPKLLVINGNRTIVVVEQGYVAASLNVSVSLSLSLSLLLFCSFALFASN